MRERAWVPFKTAKSRAKDPRPPIYTGIGRHLVSWQILVRGHESPDVGPAGGAPSLLSLARTPQAARWPSPIRICRASCRPGELLRGRRAERELAEAVQRLGLVEQVAQVAEQFEGLLVAGGALGLDGITDLDHFRVRRHDRVVASSMNSAWCHRFRHACGWQAGRPPPSEPPAWRQAHS
jgi:hypothetical protein